MQRVLPVSRLTLDPTQDPARWALLPGLCCQAAGGDPHWADDLAVAWFLFYTAAHLFDHIEDQDPVEDGSPVWAPGVSTNLATGMLIAASLALNRLHQDLRTREVAFQITDDFYRSILTMCNGQHQDLISPQPTIEQWMAIASAKSGAFFRLACRAGASLATERAEIVAAFGEYGFRLGLLLQILDDLGDFRQITDSGSSILSLDAGRSLAVAYARDVLPTDQRLIFIDTLDSASENVNAAQQVVDQLTECGAGFYLDIEIERQRSLGIEALSKANPQSSVGEILTRLLNDLGKDSVSTG